MEFGGEVIQVANKDHTCLVCGQLIPSGTSYSRYKGKWEGEWQNWAAHIPCMVMYMRNASPDPVPSDLTWKDAVTWAKHAKVLDLFVQYYRFPGEDELETQQKQAIREILKEAALEAIQRALEEKN